MIGGISFGAGAGVGTAGAEMSVGLEVVIDYRKQEVVSLKGKATAGAHSVNEGYETGVVVDMVQGAADLVLTKSLDGVKQTLGVHHDK